MDIIKYNNRYKKDLYRLYGRAHGIEMKDRELKGQDDSQDLGKAKGSGNIMLLNIKGRIKGYMIYRHYGIWGPGNIVNIDEIYIEKDYDTKSNYDLLLRSIKRYSLFKCYDYARICLAEGKFESEIIDKLNLEPSKKLIQMKTDIVSRRDLLKAQNITFTHFKKGIDEAKRMNLQNSIFKGTDGHIDLNVRDILNEEKQDYFIDDGGIFISLDGNLAGYSQIILEKESREKPYIVNFGISEIYRRHGLGLVLLEYTLDVMKTKGFSDAYVTVDADNTAAYNLYRSVGFHKVSTMCSYLYKYR